MSARSTYANTMMTLLLVLGFVPYKTVYIVYHTPLDRFSVVGYVHSWNSAGAKKSRR